MPSAVLTVVFFFTRVLAAQFLTLTALGQSNVLRCVHSTVTSNFTSQWEALNEVTPSLYSTLLAVHVFVTRWHRKNYNSRMKKFKIARKLHNTCSLPRSKEATKFIGLEIN
ncbi:hypothetical protein CDAR_393851 [Caerostris darwini]|uniref:Secreted protein n=1 Tax=Caerostris darwini TaxID=1538125 RepID=A0AAV4PG22_9ARAC|nr:hypothetical protein CDAR_393851 [Caerostris darwini]